MIAAYHADFYLAVATAIPVLLVVYAVGVSRYSAKLGESYDANVRVIVASVLNFVTRPSGWLRSALRATGASLLGGAYLLLALLALLFVVLPGVGEYEALHALSSDSASSTAEALSLIGVLAALLATIAPLVLVALRLVPFVPFVSHGLTAVRSLRTVRGVYSSLGRAGRDAGAWAGEALSLICVEDDESRAARWERRADFAQLAQLAWGEGWPEWEAAVVHDDRRVLVLDLVGSARQATFFELDRRKVARMVVYRDRQQALEALDSAESLIRARPGGEPER